MKNSGLKRGEILRVNRKEAKLGMRAEILFPHKSIASLTNVRNGKWRDLTKRVSGLPEDHPDSLAFSLMMIRQCSCLDCNPDRYKALMGCAACAKRTLASYKGQDDSLVKAFQKARAEVDDYLKDRTIAEAA